MKRPKIVIVAAANNFTFIKDLVPALSEDFDIRMMLASELTPGAGWKELMGSDLIWLEWADGISMDLLRVLHISPNASNIKVILRLHRYEVFSQRTLNDISKLPQKAKSKIDKLVFVSKKVKEIATMHFPWMCEGVVIPNLIDTDKFPFTDRLKGYNILMLGRMSYVKNLPLALTMFHELVKLDSNYKLHVVGEISDPELRYYVGNFLDKTGLHTNTYFHGRMDNDKLPEFMKDMHYIMCSSIFESQGMGILEAMCCGLKPVIFDFPGAENIFPEKWRWTDRTGFIQNILSPDYHPFEYYKFVTNDYGITNQIFRYKDLIYETLNIPYRTYEIQCCVSPPFNDGLHCAGISKEHHDKHCTQCKPKDDLQTDGKFHSGGLVKPGEKTVRPV